MPGWLEAGGWGLLAGSALLLGATVGYLADISRRIIASIMAFGAGVRGGAYVFGLWGRIALISGLSAIAGYTIFADAPAALLGWITALAGGAILTMVADTMIPEAFEDAHLLIGLITVTGFLLSFALSHL